MNPRYQPHNDDTTRALWDNVYLVKMPEIHSMSTEYMRTYGVPSTGNRKLDHGLAGQSFQRWMAIHEMVEYYAKGVPISIIDQNDVPKIYDAIERHIGMWSDLLSRGINVGDAPLDDLLAMDEFAQSLYQYAKFTFRPDNALSLFKRQLESITRFRPNTILKPLAEIKGGNVSQVGDALVINQKTEDQYPERESLGRFFTDKMIRNYRPKE